MKQIYGWVLFLWLAFEQIIGYKTDAYGIASLLGALCLFIIKEKYFDKNYASAAYLIFAVLLSTYNREFIVLLGIPIIDFAYRGNIPISLLLFTVASYFSVNFKAYDNIFYLLSSGLFGYAAGIKVRNEKEHLTTLDEERRLRYNLERVQKELVSSRQEIEHMTEIRERNRIAHEIHDNIGHGIAGVIFQIEGARRIIKKDSTKAEEILKLCSEKLSETLELTRNTVYNIRPDKILGVDRIEKIIKDFKFCSVNFHHSGDFNSVSASTMRILETNIKELFTNASKYSRATNIEIKIDIGKRNARLYYKDNGIGCDNIRDGLGLSGMRERVKNVGGTISIDGSSGFLIVCNLPVEDIYDSEVELL